MEEEFNDSELNLEGPGNPDYSCKSARRGKKDVNLYIVEFCCNPAQHSTDWPYTVGQTRFVENTTHRSKAYFNNAHEKVIVVSVPITSFIEGIYRIYFEAGS